MNLTHIKLKVEMINAETAKSYLSKMVKNRRLRRKHVEWLKTQMVNGSWLLSNNAIAFNKEGMLVDGQHRLTAVLESGKEQPFIVVRGLEEQAFDVIDTGKRRSAPDILSIEGFPYSMEVSAIVRMTMMMDTGRYAEGEISLKGTTNHTILQRALSEREKYTRLAISAKRLSYESGKLMPPSVFGGLAYFFELQSQAKSDNFFEMLAYGINLTKDTPIYVLRRELTNWKQSTLRYRARDMTALVIKAWNAFVKDEPMTRITWAPKREPFPTIRNWKSIQAKARHRQTSIELENEPA